MVAFSGILTRPRWAALALVVAASAYLLHPLLQCGGACVVDFDTSFATNETAGHLALPDTRLNTWILWWVREALATDPRALFDGNVFWPAERVLAGSEHMMTVALVTWPVRTLSDDAVVAYSGALFLTSVVAGFSTYAFVSWVTKDAIAAIVAGLIAVLMPWRVSELVHVQLLTAGILPLIWLYTAKVFADKAVVRTTFTLATVWLVLLFSSYYVGYFALFSTAVFVAVLGGLARGRRARIGLVGMAMGLPSLALAVFSLPYLRQQQAGQTVLKGEMVKSLAPGWVIDQLTPGSFTLGPPPGAWERGYEIPLTVFVLAGLGLLFATHRRVASSLVAAMALALVMSFGQTARFGGTEIPLPAAWASAFLPGFSNLRGSLRWTIILGVAMPVLAGMGFAFLRAFVASRLPKLAALGTLSILGLLAVDLRAPGLATVAPYDGRASEEAGLVYLRSLDAGPVLDFPWPENPVKNALVSSEYMLASTVHGKPIVAGYTAHAPIHYDFLLRAARRFPHPDSVARFRDLTGIRWIVLHERLLDAASRGEWDDAARDVPLITAYRDDALTIYELMPEPTLPNALEALRSPLRLPQSITGRSRERLELAADDGVFAASPPATLPGYANDWTKAAIPVRIENRSPVDWAGLDPHREGMVLVRYGFRNVDGKQVAAGFADLDADVPAGGTLSTYVLVSGHLPAGTYTLELDLVQQIEDAIIPLPLPPTRATTVVRPVG